MTDLPEQDVPPQAPPSYDELTAGEAARSDDVDAKDDSKANVKAAVDDKPVTTAIPSSQPTPSSSSQLFAAHGSRIVTKKLPFDDRDARRIDLETWPGRGPRQRTDAVYGLYVETQDMYGGLLKMKITDYNGGVIYRCLHPLRQSLPLEVQHLWTVAGDEGDETTARKQPRSSWRLPTLKSPLPAEPPSWTWKLVYDKTWRTECIDGRVSYITNFLHQDEHQVSRADALPMRRDRCEFTAPTARKDKPGRTFVWLADGIMRNSRSQRWDRGAYVLHEKGDLTKQYGAFVWNDFTMDFRELPDVLEHEHPLLFHALGNLISCQFHQCSKWPGPYEQSGFSKDKSRSFFSVATLQRRAAEMLGSRFRLTPQ